MAVVALSATTALTSCRTTSPVGAEAIRIEYRDRHHIERDTIATTDTVRIEAKGDTIYKEVIKWRTHTRTIATTDTLRLRDTIRIVTTAHPPATTTEASRRWYTPLLTPIVYLAWGIAAALLLAAIVKIYTLIRRK